MRSTGLCESLITAMKSKRVELQTLIGRQNALGLNATHVGLLCNNLTWAAQPAVMHMELHQMSED